MGKTYTIGEVAKIIGVVGKNSSTVRLWTEIFADWLSPFTRPTKGQLRLYTEDDVRILVAVRDLRQEHAPYDEIRSRLAAGNIAMGSEVGGRGEPAPPSAVGGLPMVGVDELREVLAPVFEVAEALGRFSRESDQVRFGFQMEFTRLAASIEALREKLSEVQNEIQALRAERTGSGVPAGQRSEASAGQGGGDLLSSSVGSGPRSKMDEPTSSMFGAGSGSLSPFTPRGAAPSDETSSPGVLPRSSAPLNEYGLRPLPPQLAVQSLGSLLPCRLCGSATIPLGITPTSRAVLACTECGERVVVPVDRLEKALGLSKGFWARLWDLITRPFFRRAS